MEPLRHWSARVTSTLELDMNNNNNKIKEWNIKDASYTYKVQILNYEYNINVGDMKN